MSQNITNNRGNFGTRLGIILATAGGAVGLGNVWRFPYVTGQNGGAAFILIYIICVLLMGIPVMLCEFMVGRHAQANTARAYSKLANGTPWRLVGYIGVLTAALIIGYYGVVSGWTLEYVIASAANNLHGTPEYFQQMFKEFSGNPVKPVIWMALIVGMTHFVIVHGVQDGIEKASKIMMPVLFILLLVLVGCSLSLPGAWKGVEFLFKPDFSKVSSGTFLEALGQAFYSLSIAMGCLCTYASYFKRDTNLTQSAVQIATIDTLVAILAGLMIFPAAMSVGVQPDSGPSLIFITLPNVIEQAFSGMEIVQYVVSLAFYMLLTIAALTSNISLHEVSTSFLSEEFHLGRKRAARIVSCMCIIVGALCSLSLGNWSALKLFDMSLFGFLDWFTANICLPLGGFLTCIFVGWYVDHKFVHDELSNWGTIRAPHVHAFVIAVKYICPLLTLLIFLHQFGLV
ncbi:MAG: sodium-dependent transporter [Prevotella sp.]|nr:sodium-dependent transporter [Prevotella sp.]